jgi:hypothetical protein
LIVALLRPTNKAQHNDIIHNDHSSATHTMRVSPCVLPQRAVAALCLAVVLLLCSSPTRGGVQAVRSLQIASPLQALTLWDAPVATPRSRFLPRFAKALQAEHDARAAATTVAEDAAVPPDNSSSNHNNNWAQQAAAADRSRARQAEVKAGAAFEHAFRAADAEDDASVTATTTLPPPRSATYQLVGVVQQQQQHSQGNAAPPGHDPAICWYARPKAADATWSVRLVHVNRQAIVYDLFTRGKVDVLAKFRNRGCFLQSAPPDESASSSSSSSTTAAATTVTSSVPLVEAEYTVRERSWK